MRTLKGPNMTSASRDLAPAACVSCGRFSSLPAFFPVAFLEQIPSAFHLVPGFDPGPCLRSSDVLGVGCDTPTTPRILHLLHFFLLACNLGAFLLSSLRVQHFPRRRYTNFEVAAENSFALIGCITTSRCCWQASNVSIDEFSHQSTSCRDIVSSRTL